MHENLLDLLRCPFCGTRVSLVDNDALVRTDDGIESGVLGCECCAFPIVAGIPVMIADETTRRAMQELEAGRGEDALFTLLGLDETGGAAFRALLARGDQATYRDAIGILSPDPEGTYFVYRFSDPTYLLAQAVLQALGQQRWTVSGRVLDVCGGSGHLTRVITSLQSTGGTVFPGAVLADVYYWKLWLASHITAPECAPVCCDANQPLPFHREAFSMTVLSDAFPYIWHKRLLAEEMMRLTGPEGAVVMPHLHSALGDNFSAGMTLTPTAYMDLFAPQQPRLFSDAALLTQLLDGHALDLTHSVSPADLGTEPSFTLVASPHTDLFRRYQLPDAGDVEGELTVNPLYRVERRGNTSVLALTFPTPEYEEEFGDCRRYLPETVTVAADLTGPLDAASVRSSLRSSPASSPGSDYEDLRRRRVLIDAPRRYC